MVGLTAIEMGEVSPFTFQCAVRDDSPTSTLELICVEITPPKAKPFIIILWYRPPNNPIEDFDKLEQALQFFESEGKEIILLGDKNCDLLHRETASNLDHVIPNLDHVILHLDHVIPNLDHVIPNLDHIIPYHVKWIVDIYDSYDLKQLITEPTRETIHTCTLIDHIAVSNTNNIVESGFDKEVRNFNPKKVSTHKNISPKIHKSNSGVHVTFKTNLK